MLPLRRVCGKLLLAILLLLILLELLLLLGWRHVRRALARHRELSVTPRARGRLCGGRWLRANLWIGQAFRGERSGRPWRTLCISLGSRGRLQRSEIGLERLSTFMCRVGSARLRPLLWWPKVWAFELFWHLGQRLPHALKEAADVA